MRSRHFTVLRIGLACILLGVLTHTRADPDLWGHVRFGHDMLASRTIVQADSYSFLSDRAWINHEWLAECTMYVAYLAAGGVGLVMLKVLLLLAMAAAVLSVLRMQGVHDTQRDLLIALAVFGTFAQGNHMRPQVFSLAAFAWLLYVLVSAGCGRPWRLAVIPPLMAIWVNLHGGWIVGGGTLAVWTLCTQLTDAPRREKALILAVGLCSAVATLANPYGWRMWAFLWETVGFGRMEITEWQPVYMVDPAILVIWSIVALTATVAVIQLLAARRTEDASYRFHARNVVVVLMLAVASFRVNRLLAFFALGVVMLLGPQLAAAIGRARSARRRQIPQPSQRFAATALAAGIAIIVGGVVTSARNASCVQIEASWFPEPGLGAALAASGLRGKMVNWFDWGEYAIWYVGGPLSVSTDGRRETVYSDEVLRKHVEFYFVPSTRHAFLKEVQADYIWLPAHLAGTRDLEADGWHVLFAGPRSVLLGRTPAQPLGPVSARQDVRRCFPGP